MIQFEPQKGKAFDKLPASALKTFKEDLFVTSTKYDGNQIFIVKKNNKVTWFTSDWKQFDIPGLGSSLLHNTEDFVLIAEFMYNCEGRLGDRKKSAILTTLRTCFNKSISNPDSFKEDLCNIKVFDCLLYDNSKLINFLQFNYKYEYRLQIANLLFLPIEIQVIRYKILTGLEATKLAKKKVNQGWEGCMLVNPNSAYEIGKRVNYSIKLKYRKTVDLLCINVEPGTGQYTEMIGSLVLQDSEGRIVSVGSGLNDSDRKPELSDYYIGKIIEIEYEQIMDTYIQPTFVQVRLDKTKSD